jgi:hypothetical protein
MRRKSKNRKKAYCSTIGVYQEPSGPLSVRFACAVLRRQVGRSVCGRILVPVASDFVARLARGANVVQQCGSHLDSSFCLISHIRVLCIACTSYFLNSFADIAHKEADKLVRSSTSRSNQRSEAEVALSDG